MAKSDEPIPAFFDGLGAGLCYAAVLFIVWGNQRTLWIWTNSSGCRLSFHWYARRKTQTAMTYLALMVSPPAAFFNHWGTNLVI